MTKGILNLTAADIMNSQVKTIRPHALASEALKIMNDEKITGIFVLEEQKIMSVKNVYDIR